MKSNVNTPQGQKAIDLNFDSINSPKMAGRILDSPWKRLPDVKSFKIKIKGYDPLFKEHGINKRLAPEFEFTKYKNKRLNRYLEHQVIRLDKSRVNPTLYWRISWFLMRNSTCFRVAAWNHVYKNWHRNLSLSFVMSINNKVNQLFKENNLKLDYERVYLEETNKVRPLGVPRPEFRIYLHMFAQFLTYYLGWTLPNQHAYLPGRGTLTAWKQIILSKALWKKNIREWDFKGFFDNINPFDISDELRKRQVPEDIVQKLATLNTSEIELPLEVLRDEWYNRDVEMVRRVLEHELGKSINDTIYGPVYEEWVRTKPVWRHVLRRKFEYYVAIGRMSNIRNSTDDRTTNTSIGVPQGAATSPILANLIMQKWIDSFYPPSICIAYADDSITASDKEILVPRSHPKINWEKSELVKENGVWLKPLKFLGLIWDGKKLSAATRKGSKLLLSDDIKRLMEKYILRQTPISEKEVDEAFENLKKDKNYNEISSKSWEAYFKSSIIGFVQSRLYNGKWNLENLEQDFNLKYSNSSWMNSKLNKMKDPTIFNSSSYACLSLANILRYKKRRRRLHQLKVKVRT